MLVLQSDDPSSKACARESSVKFDVFRSGHQNGLFLAIWCWQNGPELRCQNLVDLIEKYEESVLGQIPKIW